MSAKKSKIKAAKPFVSDHQVTAEGYLNPPTVQEVMNNTDNFYCSNDPANPTFSSTIAGAVYDKEFQSLIISFKRKGTADNYIYSGVPLDIWEGFKAADSKGSYAQKIIVRNFKGVKA